MIFSPTFDRRGGAGKYGGKGWKNCWMVKRSHLQLKIRIYAKNLNITKCYIMNTVLINSQFVHILEPCAANTTQKIHCYPRRFSPPYHAPQHFQNATISAFLTPTPSGSALENIKILTYSLHVAHAPPLRAEHRISRDRASSTTSKYYIFNISINTLYI